MDPPTDGPSMAAYIMSAPSDGTISMHKSLSDIDRSENVAFHAQESMTWTGGSEAPALVASQRCSAVGMRFIFPLHPSRKRGRLRLTCMCVRSRAAAQETSAA